MIKSVARKFSRSAWFWRRLPARYGGRRVLVSPSSHLAYWMKSLEHVHDELFVMIDALVRPGQCVWDIGVNVGVVSFASAAVVGPSGYVLGVEADVSLISRLRKTAAVPTPGAATVELIPAAIGDANGIARFNVSSVSSATNALAGFGRLPGVARVDLVPMITLDWLMDHMRLPDIVKIDVEGAEVLALQGGRKLFTTHRPTLVVECGDEVKDQMAALLNEFGYTAYSMNPSTKTGQREKLTAISGDVIAMPKERQPPWLDGRAEAAVSLEVSQPVHA